MQTEPVQNPPTNPPTAQCYSEEYMNLRSDISDPNCFAEMFVSPNLVVLQRKIPKGGHERFNFDLRTFFRWCIMNMERLFPLKVIFLNGCRTCPSNLPIRPRPTSTTANSMAPPGASCPQAFSSFASSGANGANTQPSSSCPTTGPAGSSTANDTTTTIVNPPTSSSSTSPPVACPEFTTSTTNATNTINSSDTTNIINPIEDTSKPSNTPKSATNKNKRSKPRKTDGDPPKRRSRCFDYRIREMLINWMIAHKQHPYCTREEKLELARKTGLEVKQITMWLINNRRRSPAFLK